MGLIVTPFGAPAWERRREILKDIIAKRPGPPFDFRDVLYLVGNERTAQTLRALFMDALADVTGAKGCIPPAFDTLNRVVDSRSASASQRPVVDALTRVLALEELAKSAAPGAVGLKVEPESLAPSVAPLIADALDRVYLYGVGGPMLDKLAEDATPGRLLRDVKRAYETWLTRHNLADPAAAKAAYRPKPDDFSRYTTVVLDGFYDADPAELRLMSALAGAPDFRFVVEAPGLASGQLCGPGMPYLGTDALLDALGMAGLDMSCGNAGADAQAALIAETVFGGLPVSRARARAIGSMPFRTAITIARANSPAEEVWQAARCIKGSAVYGGLSGPGRVAVYLPEQEGYLPELGLAFTRMGIPFHVPSGRPLTQSPVTAALMELVSLPVEDYSFTSIRRALANPLIRLTDGGSHPEAFARFGRAESITRGRARWLERLAAPTSGREYARITGAPLKRLFEVAGTMPEGRDRLSVWASAAAGLLDASGITTSVSELAAGNPELGYAHDELVRALGLLEEAGRRLYSKMRAGEFAATLSRALNGRWYKVGPEVRDGVRVLGGPETGSEPFEHLIAIGLSESAVPAPWKPDVFFPGTAADGLGMPGRDATRSREARRFLSLTLSAGRVTLLHPRSSGRGAAPQSPYIRAMSPLVEAGAVSYVDNVSRPVYMEAALCPAELMRSLALSSMTGAPPGADAMQAALSAIPAGTPGLGRAIAAVSPPPPRLMPTGADKQEFSVTELEEYQLCHFRYYHNRLLGSAPEDDPEDEVAPHAAGSILHRILGKFYETADSPVTPESMAASLDRLRDIARGEFAKLPDTLENSEFIRRFDETLAPEFIETEAGLAATGYEVRWPERLIRLECEDGGAGTFVLKGKIDRVELTKDGEFVVADYKTGAYPGSGKPLKDMFQLPLYAYMIRAGAAGDADGVMPVRPSHLVYYNLRDPEGGRMRDVVLVDKGLAGEEFAKLHYSRKADEKGMDDRLTDAYNKAADSVRGIRAGEFEPTCDKAHVCGRCEFIMVCERGMKNVDAGQEEDAGGEPGGEGGNDAD